jgi:transcriptional regulator with XRE-family HTH domain
MNFDGVDGVDRVLLHRWRREAGMSRPLAAEALGISSRMLAYYEDGVHAVPRAVTLAVWMLATEAGIRLPESGMGRERWVRAVGLAVDYGRGEAVVGRLIREGKRAELGDLLRLLTGGPPPDLALTDPALFRTLREAGINAMLAGLGMLKVPPCMPAHVGDPRDNEEADANSVSGRLRFGR